MQKHRRVRLNTSALSCTSMGVRSASVAHLMPSVTLLSAVRLHSQRNSSTNNTACANKYSKQSHQSHLYDYSYADDLRKQQ